MTHQSRYSSVTFYNFPKLAAGILRTPGGVVNYTVMADDYKGSAVRYLPNHPAAPYLYAIKFARRCSSMEKTLCFEVPSQTSNPNMTALALHDPFVFIERMYIHPGTKSGPAVAETILPTLIHVNKLFDNDVIV